MHWLPTPRHVLVLSITDLPCFVALSGILFRCLDMCWHTNMTNVRYGRERGLWETLGKVESLAFATQTNYILPGWNLTSDKGLGLVWLNLLPKDHLAQWEDYQTCKLKNISMTKRWVIPTVWEKHKKFWYVWLGLPIKSLNFLKTLTRANGVRRIIWFQWMANEADLLCPGLTQMSYANGRELDIKCDH